jgi:murein DD-endopeptidase MepM/ murein hydrolase activator NlpD
MRSILSVAMMLVGLIPPAVAERPPAPTIDVTARALQPGEVVVVTISGWTASAIPRLRAFGRTVPLHASGVAWEGLVGIDLDVQPGSYTASVFEGPIAAKPTVTTSLKVLAKRFPTRRLTVDPRFVEPPPEAQARIAKEAKALAALWASSANTRFWSGAFVPPVPDAANSAFGSRSVFNGQARSPHGGADFSSPAGRAVVAPNAGRVVLAEDLYYTGQTVVIDHGQGLLSLFAHLSAISIDKDAAVAPGDPIGAVGATGRVTGPHLHWTVRLGGARVDPLALIEVTSSGR